jgi:hypothetical protein
MVRCDTIKGGDAVIATTSRDHNDNPRPCPTKERQVKHPSLLIGTDRETKRLFDLLSAHTSKSDFFHLIIENAALNLRSGPDIAKELLDQSKGNVTEANELACKYVLTFFPSWKGQTESGTVAAKLYAKIRTALYK